MTSAFVSHEIPDSLDGLFEDVTNNEGHASYSIVDYNEGMSMDNSESMRYFITLVGIDTDFIEEDSGTQIILSNPNYTEKVCIDSGGLGDFFSHSFECSLVE